MRVGKKLAVVLTVVIVGSGAALLFRKDGASFRFWQSGSDDPYAQTVERRLSSDGVVVPPARVLEAATAAIAEPRATSDGQPAYQRNLTPVGALLPPIEGVVDDEALEAAGTASADASFLATSDARRHVVADGDTLSQLALRYLGRADAYQQIYELNRDVLTNPDLLPIGAVLRIPPRGGSAPGTVRYEAARAAR
jgi:nucleoid-associated protein YgaU